MFLHQLSKTISQSVFLRRGRELWDRNQERVDLPLSRLEKLQAGLFLILSDYSQGRFPPKFSDQQKAYEAEINYIRNLPGVSTDAIIVGEMQKPFWFGHSGRNYLLKFTQILGNFERLGICPPYKILELGCGTGWMAEFLALMGYEVVATTISNIEIELADKRTRSIAIKGIDVSLSFITAPMETVDKRLDGSLDFDAVYVFQALHHAYDWHAAISASFACLKPGGWLILLDEPNILHTFISYRVAYLAQTHEIGFRRKDLINQLREFRVLKIHYPTK